MELFIFAAVLFTVYIVCSTKYKLNMVSYDGKNKMHRLLFAAVVLLCLGVAGGIFSSIIEPAITYPFEEPLYTYNAYEQQFDAFLKGQLFIDEPVSKRLLELSNPYDWEERRNANVFYLWDRALYDGHYYSYFGIAPILTIYYPFYFLTGKIPSASIVCFILAIVGVIAIALLVLRLATGLCKKVNLPLLLLGTLAVEFGSLLFMLEVSADMYYIAAISALANFAVFLLFVSTAFFAKKQKHKIASYIVSGIFFVLTVMSRPNVALLGVVTAPLFLHIFFNKDDTKKQKAMQIFAFAIPVLIGAVIQMYYNSVRFDSPFDFGAAYQLTVLDVSKYVITPALFLPAMYHYFFQTPKLESTFPYISFVYNNYKGNFLGPMYLTRTIGAFCFPSCFGVFLLPSVFFKKMPLWKRSFYLLGVLTPIVLAFLDTCLGGVNIRYLSDIMFMCVLVSALLLLEFYSGLESESSCKQKIAYSIISLLFVCTAILGFFLIFENERFSVFRQV